jgi:ABC-type transporter Mla maintaining outer membrane lipid asymmetry ATPase subunit MlaF
MPPPGREPCDEHDRKLRPEVALLYDGSFRWYGSLAEFRLSTNPYVEQFRSGSLRGPMQPAEL